MKLTNFIPQVVQNVCAQAASSSVGHAFGRVFVHIKTPLKVLVPFALLAGLIGYRLSKRYSNYPVSKPLFSDRVQADVFKNCSLKMKAELMPGIIAELDKQKLPAITNLHEYLRFICSPNFSIEIQAIRDARNALGLMNSRFLVAVIKNLLHGQDSELMFNNLSKMGIHSLKDMQLLKIRTWDQELETLITFECAFRAHPEDQSIQAGLDEFLRKCIQKMQAENGEQFIADLSGYLSMSTRWLQLIAHSRLDIQTVVRDFKALYLVKQHAQLHAYINQPNGLFHWGKIQESGIQSLSKWASIRELFTGDFYQLNSHLHWE